MMILVIGFIGCEKESNGCGCTKSYYHIDTYIWFDDNGLPHIGYDDVFDHSEGVVCQDEVHEQFTVGDNYFNITCE